MNKLIAILIILITINPLWAQKKDKISCTVCNGTGSLACYMCSGLGERLQTKYNYNGYTSWVSYITVPCEFCGANGKITCWSCYGKGYIIITPLYNNIPSNNNFKHSNNRNICSGCGGSGNCTGCGGTGKMQSESYYTDGHTIISNCPVCGGNGKCGVCKGLGHF